MRPETHAVKQKAIGRLKRLSFEIASDPDIVDVMPIEEVRAKIETSGMGVKDIHSRIARTLAEASGTETENIREKITSTLIKWISPLWQPQWAGQPVTAGDIQKQTKTFPIPDGGKIEISWEPHQTEDNQSYLEVSWKVDSTIEGELWCRFVNPESYVVLKEVLLGNDREGGVYLMTETLGFDLFNQLYEISLVVKEPSVS